MRDRTAAIRPGDILLYATVRDEMDRLPWFLSHYRRLGIDHFLIVDNDSGDGTGAYLAGQPDASVWTTAHGYRQSRFGTDWLTLLQIRHGHGHWCLTVDADELLIYAHHETRPLRALTDWLDGTGRVAMGALMLDLYPGGPLSEAGGDDPDPVRALPWFDAGNYVAQRQRRLRNLWVQGGVRARAFFASDPRRAPTLSKIPLVRWNRRYVYASSTHSLLPRRLNDGYDGPRGTAPSGVLLHTKFLPGIVQRSSREKERRQHFEKSGSHDGYYDALIAGPQLWCEASSRYAGWRQLEGLGLMSRGGWE